MFKAAVVQAASLPFDPMGSSEKAAKLVREAASNDARLVVFPEAFIGGYPKGMAFGTVVGSRKPEGRQAFSDYHRAAVDLDGPEIKLLRDVAAETDTFLVVGIIERDGGTVYCTALMIDGPKGLMVKHRKLMPTGAERLIWGFGDGSTLPVVNSELGNIGTVICWENYMPLLRMAMYSQQVQIYCAPTADDRDTWLPSMQHIALEGRCFVLSACQYITRGSYPDDYDSTYGDDKEAVMMRGGSLIVDPMGQVLAGPEFAGETIIYAEIDTETVVRGKYDFDVSGHYARPDVFSLHVDNRPQSPVTWADGKPV